MKGKRVYWIQLLRYFNKGRAKQNSQLEQRDRNPLLMWEFWKNKKELFPKEMINQQNIQVHHLLLMFDGSNDQIPNGEEETLFYQQLIKKYKNQYKVNCFVLITKIDIMEKRIRKQNKTASQEDIDKLIQKQKSNILQLIHKKLQIDKNNIDFIENYHSTIKNRNTKIDYYALSTLIRILSNCQKYVKTKKNLCNIFQLINLFNLLVSYITNQETKFFISFILTYLLFLFCSFMQFVTSQNIVLYA